MGEEDELPTRATSFQEGVDDEDINTIVTPTTPAAMHTGPITRSRARQLNYQVLSFLSNDSNVHENMMLPELDTFVLLTNEIPPSSSIYTALRASFRLWVLFRLKVRHSCNFAYFVCVQRLDQDVTEPHLHQ